jgi:protein TonB
MRSAYSRSWEPDRAGLARRVKAVGLTVAVHLLILLLLLTLAPNDAVRRKTDEALSVFEVSPEAAPPPRRRALEVRKTRSASEPPPRPAAAPPPPPIAVPTMPPLIAGLENFDLRQLPTRPPSDGAGQGAAQQGQDSASAYGPGEGPGGARLYNAEWYREPTNAELSTYLPERRVIGWGMIACQTVPRYRVDNCRVLQSYPPGSGLGAAIKAAAWQFMVRPPRVENKPMIGAWVRIRIEFTEAGVGVR